jgi:NAD-dependent deacetylase
MARENGAFVVVVNPQPSALDATADLVLAAPAGQCLPALW